MEKFFFLEMLSMSAAHAKRTRLRNQNLGLSDGQPKMLFILSRQEGWLQKDLAEFCKISPASMTTLLNNMEKKDLIERRTTHLPNGKRAFAIYLTEYGREMAEKVNEATYKQEELALNGFTEEEKAAFFDYMARVTKNLE